MNFGLEAKVGLFVVGCLLLISAMSLKLVDFSFSDGGGISVRSYLSDAAGLAAEAPVIFRGVDVGKIGKIELENGKAAVSMEIDDEYQLPANLKVLVRSKGFLGEKFAELELQGDTPAGVLKDGDIIAEGGEVTDFDQLGNKIGDIADDVKAVTASLREVLATEQARSNMTATLTNVREITDTVNKLIQQNEQRMNMIIQNTETLTAKLSEITVANADNINEIVKNINVVAQDLRVVTASLKQDAPTITTNMRNITDDVDDVISGQKENLKKAIENIAVVTEKLETTVDNMNDITGKINEGKGTIGKLVNEEETVDNLNGALTGLKDTLGKVNQFKVDLAFSAETFGETDNSMGRVNVKITPGEKRYYLLGLSTDENGTTKTKNIHSTTNYNAGSSDSGDTYLDYTEERKETNPDAMLWTLQYAHRFWDDFYFRVGLLESEAGIGFDYHPLDGDYRDKVVLTADVFDFPDDDEDREVRTRARVKYKFYKNMFITGGYDDMLNSDTDSWFVGAGVEFRDDDLKYLLGQTPLPN